MLTKEQLEKMAKNYGQEVLEIDIPAIKAAKTALAYMKALELACIRLSAEFGAHPDGGRWEFWKELFLQEERGGHD